MSSLVFCPPRDAASAARWARRTVLGWHRCETVAPLSYGNYLDAETLARCGPEWTALYRSEAEIGWQQERAPRVVAHDPESLLADDGQMRDALYRGETWVAKSQRREWESCAALVDELRAGLRLRDGDPEPGRGRNEMMKVRKGKIPLELILEMESTGDAMIDPGDPSVHLVSCQVVEMLNCLLTARIFSLSRNHRRILACESRREMNQMLAPISLESGAEPVLVVEIEGGIPVAAAGAVFAEYLEKLDEPGELGKSLWGFGEFLFTERYLVDEDPSDRGEHLERVLRKNSAVASDCSERIGKMLKMHQLPRVNEPMTLLLYCGSRDRIMEVAKGRTHWKAGKMDWLCGGNPKGDPPVRYRSYYPNTTVKMSLQWFTRKPPAVWGDRVSVAILFEGGSEDGPSAGLFLDGP